MDKTRERVTDLEAWGRQVLDDVWSELDAATRPVDMGEEITWLEAERHALDNYIQDRGRGFVGRDAVLAQLESFAFSIADEMAPSIMCVTGAAGAGKSALFAELYGRLLRTNGLMLAHAAGAA